MNKDPNDPDYKEYLYYLNLVVNLSVTILTFIFLGAGIGFMLDRLVFKKTGPFFVCGLIVGVVMGFVHCYKDIMKHIDKQGTSHD